MLRYQSVLWLLVPEANLWKVLSAVRHCGMLFAKLAVIDLPTLHVHLYNVSFLHVALGSGDLSQHLESGLHWDLV